MKLLRPLTSLLYQKARRRLLGERSFRRWAFQRTYEKARWGMEEGSAFFSGAGSRGHVAARYVENIVPLLRNLAQATATRLTIVDLGCGDFHIGRALTEALPSAQYIGCDIVPELIAHHQRTWGSDRISFQVVDIVSNPLSHGDVALVRQVLQHLSNADIIAFMKRNEYPTLLVTEGQPERRSGSTNPDKAPGPHVRFNWTTGIGSGIELDQPPFCYEVEELFRVPIPGHETIATYRVIGHRGASQ